MHAVVSWRAAEAVQPSPSWIVDRLRCAECILELALPREARGRPRRREILRLLRRLEGSAPSVAGLTVVAEAQVTVRFGSV
jgi:hypothetical protein